VRWLTADGVVAALAVGSAVTWGLGLGGLAILAAFFISGSLLTQLSGGSGGQRNARQVLANGGVAAVAAAFGSWYGAAGALAAATADTWATEIGSYSSTAPRMITTMAAVAPGTSGGVTALGTLGGIAGGPLLGSLAALVSRGGWRLATVALVAGVVGMLADSLAGATLQRRGLLDNDAVNVVATATGAALALLGSVIL
jgi:uncharacterized protein (TIGR00297 family)